jgi:hypothetical protein
MRSWSIETAEALVHVGKGCVDGCRVGDVELLRLGATARPRDRRDDLLRGGLVAGVVHDDVGTGTRERLGDRTADPARASCDDRHLTGEVEHARRLGHGRRAQLSVPPEAAAALVTARPL